MITTNANITMKLLLADKQEKANFIFLKLGKDYMNQGTITKILDPRNDC
jgi:hypothetical protein